MNERHRAAPGFEPLDQDRLVAAIDVLVEELDAAHAAAIRLLARPVEDPRDLIQAMRAVAARVYAAARALREAVDDVLLEPHRRRWLDETSRYQTGQCAVEDVTTC